MIKSVTGQLAWDTSGQGFFTVNTPGTKAVVGFAGGKEQTLGDVKVRLETPFAALFLTALESGKDLTDGKRALLTVIARECNTGFTYFTPDNRAEERRGADPAGAGEGGRDRCEAAGRGRDYSGSRWPAHRPERPRDGRPVRA